MVEMGAHADVRPEQESVTLVVRHPSRVEEHVLVREPEIVSNSDCLGDDLHGRNFGVGVGTAHEDEPDGG